MNLTDTKSRIRPGLNYLRPLCILASLVPPDPSIRRTALSEKMLEGRVVHREARGMLEAATR